LLSFSRGKEKRELRIDTTQLCMIATGKMKLVNIACMAALRNAYRVVVGNPEGKELGVIGKVK
jgi:hypothetical protein